MAKLSLLRVLLFIVLVIFLQPALGQDGEEGEAAPVAEPAGEPAAAAEVGEEAEGAAEGAAPAQMTEEQQKQQQEVQKLYMEYLRRFLSDTCQMELQALQSFITATPETEDQPEKAEKIKAFESQCGEEMKKVRLPALHWRAAWALRKHLTFKPFHPSPPHPPTCALAARGRVLRKVARRADPQGNLGPCKEEAPGQPRQPPIPHAKARAVDPPHRHAHS